MPDICRAEAMRRRGGIPHDGEMTLGERMRDNDGLHGAQGGAFARAGKVFSTTDSEHGTLCP